MSMRTRGYAVRAQGFSSCGTGFVNKTFAKKTTRKNQLSGRHIDQECYRRHSKHDPMFFKVRIMFREPRIGFLIDMKAWELILSHCFFCKSLVNIPVPDHMMRILELHSSKTYCAFHIIADIGLRLLDHYRAWWWCDAPNVDVRPIMYRYSNVWDDIWSTVNNTINLHYQFEVARRDYRSVFAKLLPEVVGTNGLVIKITSVF